MLRPTTSAIKYAQMRGRGSRLCPRIGKTSFLIYDFVGNHSRFNDPGAQYHRPRQVGRRPQPGSEPGPEPGPEPTPSPPPGPPRPPREFTVIPMGEKEDAIRRRELIHVGPEGMAVDRKTYQDGWVKRIQELRDTDLAVRKIMAGESLTESEWDELAQKLNSPEFWFEESALRKAFEQPSGSLSDFIRAALGLYQLPTRQQRVERAFNVWVAENSNSINPDQARLLSLLRNVVAAAVTETKYVALDPSIFSNPPFTFQGGRARAEALFGRDRLTAIMQELNDLVAAA
jgi:type I restriction enzyme R subunit